MSLEFAGLGGLFLAALIASTIVPASSEAVLAGLVASGAYAPWMLVATASLGNVLGATINWALGRWAAESRWVRENARLARASLWFRRYGAWSLLLSWLPIIGDPLTLAAGLARLRFLFFLLPVAVGKVGRYLVVFYLADWISRP
ncbi:YqaA family protein [Dongia deserti]|uniref:YqaA family protein n=1 Tax=Dongia deserti TaxID=2268030 RepID=UPI000E64CE68|nr:YqaA family protein [Dongia deserti]